MKKQTDLPGGKFTATQNEDGTWNIENVPIFAQHKVKFGEEEKEIGQDWLLKAKAREDSRVSDDNYLPPLHIHHHGARETERAGFFRSKSVAQANYQGKPLWMTFADLVRIPAEIFDKIKAGGLPYRSVEVHSLDEPEINSLALLDDEVPFFRLSLLTIGNQVPAEGMKVGETLHAMDPKTTEPLLAYRARGAGSNVLMNLDGKHLRRQDMPETEEEKKKRLEAEKKKGEKLALEGDAMAKLAEALNGAIAQLQGAVKMLTGGEGDAPAGGGAPAPAENLSAKDDGKGSGADDDKGASKDYAAEIAKLPPEARGAVAALMGRVDVAEGKVGRMEHEGKVEKAVYAVTKELLTYGLDQEKTTKTLFDLARKDGIPAMQSYAQAVKDHGTADPLPGVESAEAIGKLPKEMQVFANLGEGVLEKAVKYSKEFDNLKGHGMKLEFGRQQYVADCLEAEGHKVELPEKDKKDKED